MTGKRTQKSGCAAGRLWVTADENDQPVGFAAVELVDGRPHIQELDVHPDHGRRGLGGAAIGCKLAWMGKSTGRDDWIRTSDPHTPSMVRYQAALHPETSGGRPYRAAHSHWQAAISGVECGPQFAALQLRPACNAANRAHLP
mgnify:CR=1 FL=1